MLRSLYSGISGMKVNQTKLDVIGNNIANVGTTSFKGARVRFQDMLSQNVSQALGPGLNQGGVNPRQVGLGVQIAGIDTLVAQGMMQPTSRNLDVAIDGDGYFMVGSGPIPNSNGDGVTLNDSSLEGTNGMLVQYTRDGSFTLDEQGNLLTSDGNRVLGYSITEGNGLSSIEYNNGTSIVSFADINSPRTKADTTLVPLKISDRVFKAKFFDPTAPTEMTLMGTTPSGKAPVIANEASDQNYTGTAHSVNVRYTAPVAPATVGNWEYKFDTESGWTALNASGVIPGGLKVTIPTGTDVPTADVEYSQEIASDARVRTFSIGKNGVVSAVLEDGSVSALGQLSMASFKNPAGLTKVGKNLYDRSANSGEPVVRSGLKADKDNSQGYGDMLQGMLEMSNVDLAEQFTDMIVTSRAFQANSKTISTGDEILQDILNLKR